MKTDVEKLDPTRVRLSVEVPFAELKPSLDSAYREIGRQVRVPGFRPGKVPQRIIDARVGRAAVLEQAVNEAIPAFYGAAVEESGVHVLGQPDVDVTNIDDGTLLTFTAEVEIRPDFELPPREAVEVTVDTITVADADVDAQIDEQIDRLRERFAAANTVDRPAADGDLVTIDLSARDPDGELLDGGEVVGQTYKLGSGTMLDGLDDAVLGTSAGDTATFSTTLVGGAAGQEATVTVGITAVKEQQLPELDDEFAQLASEFDTVEELRADTRDTLERIRRRQQLVNARDAVLESYVASIDIPVPAGLLAHELEHRTQGVDSELERYGLTKEQYVGTLGKTLEEFDADNAQRASEAIKAQFVLDAIAAAEKIELDEGELSQQIVVRAARAGVSPDQYAQQIVQSNQISALMSDVVRSKALASLIRAATVKDSDGIALDLEALEATLGTPGPRTSAMTVPVDEATDQVEVVDDGFGVPDQGDEFLVFDDESFPAADLDAGELDPEDTRPEDPGPDGVEALAHVDDDASAGSDEADQGDAEAH